MKPTRIFLVDDHPVVREWLAALLRQESDMDLSGQAEDSASALAAMIALPPDVAVVDISLKTSSGLDLIKDIASHLPETRILVFSMHEEVYYAERALRAGARGYVMKSEPTDRILEAIRAVRKGDLYASAALLSKLADRSVSRKPSSAAANVELLSDRELDVYSRLGNGQTTRQIADDLNVSIKTIQAYCTRIKIKLGLASGPELFREAVRWIVQRQEH